MTADTYTERDMDHNWSFDPECDDQIVWVDGNEFSITAEDYPQEDKWWFNVSQFFRDETGDLDRNYICPINEHMTVRQVVNKIKRYMFKE